VELEGGGVDCLGDGIDGSWSYLVFYWHHIEYDLLTVEELNETVRDGANRAHQRAGHDDQEEEQNEFKKREHVRGELCCMDW